MEEIEECDNSLLVIREAYWINKLDTYNSGYNMTEGKGEGNGTSFNARPIKQYDLDGNFIESFKSIGEAATKNNVQSANIQRAARHDCNSAGGYQWRYIEDNTPITKIEPHLSGGKGKTVYQYDEDWNLVNIFTSNRKAAKSIGLNYGLPSRWLDDNKLHYGYYWNYNSYMKEIEEEL